MKGKKRNVAHYSKAVAKEVGLPHAVVHEVLMFMTQRLCSSIQNGHDIRIKGFGRIYYKKTQHGRNSH